MNPAYDQIKDLREYCTKHGLERFTAADVRSVLPGTTIAGLGQRGYLKIVERRCYGQNHAQVYAFKQGGRRSRTQLLP